MARIVAEKCTRGCKMKRLYTRAEGGKGWDSVVGSARAVAAVSPSTRASGN